MTEQTVEIHHKVIYPNQSAMDILKQQSGLPFEQLKTCFDHGAVWLETIGKPSRLFKIDLKLKPGHTIHLYCNETTLAPCPFKAELISDQESFSIWNKPAGMLSQGSKWGEHWAIHHWVKQHQWPDRPCLISHRLDRFTQGLMIIAHDDKTNRLFHKLFEQRKINKTYRAIVNGIVSDQHGSIDNPVDDKKAVTEYTVLGTDKTQNRSLLELKPQTGRKHQIRVHLQQLGHPVMNDRQYGQPPFSGDLCLQSSELDFNHPHTEQPVHFSLTAEKLLSL